MPPNGSPLSVAGPAVRGPDRARHASSPAVSRELFADPDTAAARSGTFESARLAPSASPRLGTPARSQGRPEPNSPSPYRGTASPSSTAPASPSSTAPAFGPTVSSFYGSGSAPTGSGDLGWLGKGVIKKDQTKLNKALGYVDSKCSTLLDDIVNKTGGRGRSSKGPRAGRATPTMRSTRMLDASLSKVQGRAGEEHGALDASPSLLSTTPVHRRFDGNSNLAPSSSSGPRRSLNSSSATPHLAAPSPRLASPTTPPPPLAPHQIGFTNMNNSCYMLASLQALLGLPTLVASGGRLAATLAREGGPPSAPPLVRPWAALCQAVTRGDRMAADAEVQQLKRELGEVAAAFKGSKMQDAHEFLVQLLDLLRENISQVVGEQGDGPNPVADAFEMEVEETLCCGRCGAATVARRREVSVLCDVTAERAAAVSLQGLLEDTLKAEERERRCEAPGCGGERGVATLRLTALPRVLLLFLKRYSFTQEEGGMERAAREGSKVARQVTISPTLSLHPLATSDCATPRARPAGGLHLSPHPVPSSTTPSLHSTTPSLHFTTPSLHSTTPSLHFTTPSSPPRPAQGLASSIATPVKFKGKTDLDISRMSEEEQAEFVMFRSSRETGGETKASEVFTVDSDTDADSDLQAAIRASMEEADQHALALRQEDALVLAAAAQGLPTTSTPTTPARKRSHSAQAEHEQGTPKIRRPLTRVEEEEDLRRALEMSRSAGPLLEEVEEVVAVEEAEVAGPPERHYRLASVVTHRGGGAASGHYVADVRRFGPGGWWRYDDSAVTATSLARVVGGAGRANGYIFMYVHKPQWEEWEATSA